MIRYRGCVHPSIHTSIHPISRSFVCLCVIGPLVGWVWTRPMRARARSKGAQKRNTHEIRGGGGVNDCKKGVLNVCKSSFVPYYMQGSPSGGNGTGPPRGWATQRRHVDQTRNSTTACVRWLVYLYRTFTRLIKPVCVEWNVGVPIIPCFLLKQKNEKKRDQTYIPGMMYRPIYHTEDNTPPGTIFDARPTPVWELHMYLSTEGRKSISAEKCGSYI